MVNNLRKIIIVVLNVISSGLRELLDVKIAIIDNLQYTKKKKKKKERKKWLTDIKCNYSFFTASSRI